MSFLECSIASIVWSSQWSSLYWFSYYADQWSELRCNDSIIPTLHFMFVKWRMEDKWFFFLCLIVEIDSCLTGLNRVAGVCRGIRVWRICIGRICVLRIRIGRIRVWRIRIGRIRVWRIRIGRIRIGRIRIWRICFSNEFGPEEFVSDEFVSQEFVKQIRF